MKLLVAAWEKLGIWSSTLFEKMSLILNRKLEFLEQSSKQLKQSQKSQLEETQRLKQDILKISSNPLSKQSFNLRKKFSELKDMSGQVFAEVNKAAENMNANKTQSELQLLKHLQSLKDIREKYMSCIEKSFEHILDMKTDLER